MWRAADVATEPFGSQLRSHRIALRLTQEALAERASLSVRAIQNLERGDRHPYSDTVARLADALGLIGAPRIAFEQAGRTRTRERVQCAPALASPPTNVPAQLTACIGREADLAELVAAIVDARLVTLVGPGGSGKTRLALQLATEFAQKPVAAHPFDGGIWLAELDAITEPGLVPNVVAAALGVVETRGQELAATLVDALHERRVLLLIDNCEQVLARCAALIELVLSRCPGVRVVATSRQALGLPSEVVRQVAPLDVPPADAAPDSLGQYASVKLFLDRARAAAPDVEIGPADLPYVVSVCRQLDGMPLALELAAARVRGFPVRDLVQRLDAPFRLLTATSRPRPRQQSLRAAIDWSYDLLDDEHRRLLRQLSVFCGGWTLRAVESVCGTSSAYELAHLIDHSLVQVDWRDHLAPRYRLLETVRQYAFEQLTGADEARAVRDAHLSYYLGFAEAAEAGLDGADQLDWLTRLDTEHGNLRAALHWAFETEDVERGARLAAALAPYWDIRGERTEGLTWLEAAVLLSARGSAALRTRVLRAAGRLAVAVHNDRALAWLDESLALARTLGDQREMAHTLVHLGRLWVDEAALDRAIGVLEEARALARAVDDRAGMAAALLTLGQAHLDRSDYPTSLALLEESRARFAALGNRVGQANALLHLAMARLEMDDASSARAPLEAAERLLRELGDAVGVAWTQHDLARLALDTDRPVEAAALFERSLELFRALGHGTGVAWSQHNLGRSLVALGDFAAASACFESGLTLFRRLDHKRGIAWALYNQAWTALEQGAPAAARPHLIEALQNFRALSLPAGLSATVVAAARLVAPDDPHQAAHLLTVAQAIHTPTAQDRRRAESVQKSIQARRDNPAPFAPDLNAELEALQRHLAAVPA